MLPIKAIEAAVPLSVLFDQNDRMLVAVPNTPLALLTNATYKNANSAILSGTTEPEGYRPDLYGMEYMTNAKDGVIGECVHDTVMDELTEIGVKAIQAHIYKARTIVKPVIVNLVERVVAEFEALKESDVLNKEVCVEDFPLPMTNNALEDLAAKFGNVAIEDPEYGLKIPQQDYLKISDLLKSGVPSLDKDIAVWSAALGESFFVALWNEVFSVHTDNGTTPFSDKSLRQLITDSKTGMDVAIAVFLLGNSLYDTPPEGTEMNLEAYNDLTSRYRNQAAAQIGRFIEKAEKSLQSGILVTRTQDTSKIFVNGQVYRKFLEDGGNNDVLLGRLVSESTDTTAAVLIEKAADYTSAWQRYVGYANAAEDNHRYEKMKKILCREFRAQLVEASLEAEEDQLIAASKIDQLTAQFDTFLLDVRMKDFDDLYDLCLRGLCATRFAGTDVMELLSDIDAATKANPNLTAREAATIAEARYIVRWVLEQIQVAPL